MHRMGINKQPKQNVGILVKTFKTSRKVMEGQKNLVD
jgi:hypothetical protein